MVWDKGPPLVCSYPGVPALICWIFSPLNDLGTLVENQMTTDDHSHAFISRLSILFHWSVRLSLCQYHTVFIIVFCSKFLKLKKCEFSEFVFVFWDCFGHSGDLSRRMFQWHLKRVLFCCCWAEYWLHIVDVQCCSSLLFPCRSAELFYPLWKVWYSILYIFFLNYIFLLSFFFIIYFAIYDQ